MEIDAQDIEEVWSMSMSMSLLGYEEGQVGRCVVDDVQDTSRKAVDREYNGIVDDIQTKDT
ncbi:hypothetical protein BOTCAL_0165g00100 [Botryotinia calthae]|uniref:Uncharacterized protein n=1 Tax=Botryotinia calthae TaxID=38488 RepID=A0A4Y8D1J1_9HELO|nr:hypothetical protein BOTCAL_0165g00100 [Botryotinia calthae]